MTNELTIKSIETVDYPAATGGSLTLDTGDKGPIEIAPALNLASGKGYKGGPPGCIRFLIGGTKVVLELHHDKAVVLGKEMALDEDAAYEVWSGFKQWMAAAYVRAERGYQLEYRGVDNNLVLEVQALKRQINRIIKHEEIESDRIPYEGV
jgi:hypothetical protein